MTQKIQTPYRHPLGPIVICQGIGRSLWGAYIVKANGSLKRSKSIPTQPTPEGVLAFLEAYRGKAIWKAGPEETQN